VFFDESEPHMPMETPRIEDLVEIVRKQINEDKPQFRGVPGSSILKILILLFLRRSCLIGL